MFIGFGWLVVDRILFVDWIGGRSEVLFVFFLHILCKCCWNLCVFAKKSKNAFLVRNPFSLSASVFISLFFQKAYIIFCLVAGISMP